MSSHILSNSVFLKNLSPLLTTDIVREFLTPHIPDPNEILRIEFKMFAGTAQRYCQVDFRTSSGVTAATSQNGQSLLGVPLVITVIDPTIQASLRPPLLSWGYGGVTSSLTDSCPDHFLSHSLGYDYPPRETEEQQLTRTVHVANLPQIWTLREIIDHLIAHVKEEHALTLEVVDNRLIDGAASDFGKRVALIEFKTTEMADAVRNLSISSRTIDSHELIISRAKTTVTLREPDNVSFNLPPSVPVPVAYQQLNKLKLQEKISKAKALADRLASKSLNQERKQSGFCLQEEKILNSAKATLDGDPQSSSHSKCDSAVESNAHLGKCSFSDTLKHDAGYSYEKKRSNSNKRRCSYSSEKRFRDTVRRRPSTSVGRRRQDCVERRLGESIESCRRDCFEKKEADSLKRRCNDSMEKRKRRSFERRYAHSSHRRRSSATGRHYGSMLEKHVASFLEKRRRSKDRRHRYSIEKYRDSPPEKRSSRSPERRFIRSPKRRSYRSPRRLPSCSPERRSCRSPRRLPSFSPGRRSYRSPKRLLSYSPKRRSSRSPGRLPSCSLERRSSRSTEKRRGHSPEKRASRSTEKRRGHSHEKRASRSTEKRRGHSPEKRNSRSTEKCRGHSVKRRRNFSAERRGDYSPERRRNYSPERRRDYSPERRRDPSVERRRGRSLERRRGRSLERRRARSLVKRRDYSLERRRARSLERRRARSPERHRESSFKRQRGYSSKRHREYSLGKPSSHVFERRHKRSLEKYENPCSEKRTRDFSIETHKSSRDPFSKSLGSACSNNSTHDKDLKSNDERVLKSNDGSTDKLLRSQGQRQRHVVVSYRSDRGKRSKRERSFSSKEMNLKTSRRSLSAVPYDKLPSKALQKDTLQNRATNHYSQSSNPTYEQSESLLKNSDCPTSPHTSLDKNKEAQLSKEGHPYNKHHHLMALNQNTEGGMKINPYEFVPSPLNGRRHTDETSKGRKLVETHLSTSSSHDAKQDSSEPPDLGNVSNSVFKTGLVSLLNPKLVNPSSRQAVGMTTGQSEVEGNQTDLTVHLNTTTYDEEIDERMKILKEELRKKFKKSNVKPKE
ncbi:serine/arginine repetitive matrix protein 2-like isoform X2 [Hylaeus volcanicus]|uniref:serine/arginine repetitive matrix protein 2-like isoform X2 n=1 Tax=Hylaeus volcanicus TaxID=313075 RepID=UPI0023B7B3F6|nr:serine/arginine repetitive matrix protein 2-like isoform X2 [Hylaeus volcanicus]